MELGREKAIVHHYHFDVRNHQMEQQKGVPATKIQVDFQLNEKNREENKTAIVAILNFMIVMENHVISGTMTQGIHILNRIVEEPTDLNEEEKRLLVSPLLDILYRLTDEVTEIAFDAPGIKLEF